MGRRPTGRLAAGASFDVAEVEDPRLC